MIALDFHDYLLSGFFLNDTVVTLYEAFLGLAIGIVTGVGLGLLFAYSKTVADVFEPIIAGLNALPRIALGPLLILWFGLGLTSKVILSSSIVLFVIFYNTYHGARSIDPDLLRTVKIMKASRRQVVRFIVLPSVFSWIFAALRVGIVAAVLGAIVGEFVGASAGLGYRIMVSSGLLQTERIYAVLLWLMVIGALLVEATTRIEERVLKWRPAVQFG